MHKLNSIKRIFYRVKEHIYNKEEYLTIAVIVYVNSIIEPKLKELDDAIDKVNRIIKDGSFDGNKG